MKINIAEILKDCPKGMKLYSPLLGNVTLEKVGISNTASIIVNDGFNTDGFLQKQVFIMIVKMENVYYSLLLICETG